MFDVFDILVPTVPTDPRVTVRKRETAWGATEQETVWFADVPVGTLDTAKSAYTNLEAWAGSSGRAHWFVLLAAQQANDAAANDETWRSFLLAIEHILNGQSAWRVTCESDCEEYPVDDLEPSVEHLVRLLDQARASGQCPIAFRMDSEGCT